MPTLEVHADPARLLSAVDPLGRNLHLSCGAAILNLRIAAEHIGFEPRTPLLPDGDVPTHLATVYLLPAHRLAPQTEALFDAVHQRRTTGGRSTAAPCLPA